MTSPLPIVVIDWETYYDGEYSLSKMSTEAYLRDPRFEEIGAAIMLPDQAYPRWYSDPRELRAAIKAIDWSTHALLCHHGQFDGAILAWHHGIIPRFYLDSMAMGQPHYGFTSGVSLAKLSETLGLGQKGDEVIRAIGKRRRDFTREELAAYGSYCCNDAYLCKLIYERLLPQTPTRELMHIDQTIRCFTDPRIELDEPLLREYHQHVCDVKETRYIWMGNLIGCEPEEVKDIIMSNQKMADLMRKLGVEPPTKLSPATGKETYAFAKDDEDFIALKHHDDERIQTLVECRLGGKSTQAETRALTFIEMAKRGPMPAYYKYYAAHPGRLGGGDGSNLQNLPRGGVLRNALMAPPSQTLVAGDLSQIEARIVVTLAEQLDVVQIFRDFDAKIGPDIYCVTATNFLGRLVTPDMKDDRRLGKTIALALQYGMGVDKFIVTAKRDGVTLTPNSASAAHAWFRHTRSRIPILWKAGEQALRALERGQSYTFGVDGCIVVKADGIHLPSGRVLRYPGLQSGPSQLFPGMTEWSYLNRKKRVRLYGPKVIENISQSLAGSVCGDAWLAVRNKMKIVLQVHDELVGVVHDSQAEEACQWMREAMSRTPAWLPQLPVACEVGHAKRFGEIKKS